MNMAIIIYELLTISCIMLLFNKDASFRRRFDGRKNYGEFSVDQLALPEKPKPENVEFFQQYERCDSKRISSRKVCKPLENSMKPEIYSGNYR